MKKFSELINQNNLIVEEYGSDGGHGIIYFHNVRRPAIVVFSNGLGWDHVSVSFSNRCPTWDEMCIVKDMFFNDDECVIQYHPPKSNYVNKYKYCLHLWKPQSELVPQPPLICV